MVVRVEQVGAADVVNQLFEAMTVGRQPAFDGRWGRATLEVILGVAQSGLENQDMMLAQGGIAGRRRNFRSFSTRRVPK